MALKTSRSVTRRWSHGQNNCRNKKKKRQQSNLCRPEKGEWSDGLAEIADTGELLQSTSPPAAILDSKSKEELV